MLSRPDFSHRYRRPRQHRVNTLIKNWGGTETDPRDRRSARTVTPAGPHTPHWPSRAELTNRGVPPAGVLVKRTHTVEGVLTDTGDSGENTEFRRSERRIDLLRGTQGWCCHWTEANSVVACQWPIVMRCRRWVSLTAMLSLPLSTVTVIYSLPSRTCRTARAGRSSSRVDPSRRR